MTWLTAAPWALTALGGGAAALFWVLWEADTARYTQELDAAEATIAAQASTLDAYRRADAAAERDAADTAAIIDTRVVIRERIVHAPPTDDAGLAPVLRRALHGLRDAAAGADRDRSDGADDVPEG